MKCRFRKGYLLLLMIVLLLMGQACEPEVPLQIENRTDMVLTIYVEGVNDGQVDPKKSIKIKNVAAVFSYLQIEAKNSKEEVIYSRKFSFHELNAADWEVIIWPLQSETESSANVTESGP